MLHPPSGCRLRDPTYGFGLGAWPLIITNGVCFLLSAFILTMTLLPQKAKDAVARSIDPAAR
ncbi:hypothetical protein B5U98_18295 [Bosea sp. Tri-39]|nr:hypothetical protein BLM15_30810 [Bosea sp. Tri-49]RXT20736.1 hypothetical protein B5U98_18295 [Bosea sp. Tri-39]RXT33716.1 hypothetical protein B5U99_18160 [Bosea sp. Tri-54]